MTERLQQPGAHEQYLEELKVLARTQPKMGFSEPGQPTAHTQYRGNFYKRIPLIKAVAEGRGEASQITYLRMVKERFALDLVRFYGEQSALCDAICEAVAAKDPYDTLVAGYVMVTKLETTGALPLGSAADLHAAAEHPLGIEAIGIYYWGQLNPLLEQAYMLIDATTLNAPFLTR